MQQAQPQIGTPQWPEIGQDQPAAPVTATRQEALARVAEYLRDAGYRGLDRSWRADDGVIDIVAQQGTSSSRAS